MINALSRLRLFERNKKLITIIIKGVPQEVELADINSSIIKVNDDEILITSGDFASAVDQNKFESVTTDENDWFKLIGVTPDGDVYVAARCEYDIPDDKREEYYARQGIDINKVDSLFGISSEK